MSKRPPRRSLQERIAEQKLTLLALEQKAEIQIFDAALKDGRVKADCKSEFRELIRELKAAHKASTAAARHEWVDLQPQVNMLSERVREKLSALISEA